MSKKTGILLGLIGVMAVQMASAKVLRFYANPYRVYEGEAVEFCYLEKDRAGASQQTYRLDEIAEWRWDFDGDGVDDAQGTDPKNINVTWYAEFDSTKSSNGIYRVTPRLTIRTKDIPLEGGSTTNYWLAMKGFTEDTHGDTGVDPELCIVERSAGSDEISVNFSGGPRLAVADTDAESGTPIRLYADAELLQEGQIIDYEWDLGHYATNGAVVKFRYPKTTEEGVYDVALTVRYILDSNPGVTNSLSEIKEGYMYVSDNNKYLSLGRSYRRGFPYEYGWEDILEAYTARSKQGDDYLYFHHFEEAFNLKSTEMLESDSDKDRRIMAEIVNECLQGQVMLGNQRLIEALRIKYPRMLKFDPENPPKVLPVPPGARKETEAIDVALLDFYSALYYPALAIKKYGADILRSRAERGNEPFDQFPQYISFVDPSLSPFEVPIKNEYWQLTTCFERMGLGSVEKAKKLFKLSLHKEEAREEAKEECKKSGIQSYLGMALLANGQSEEDFAANEGNLLLAHLKNSRNLFEMINQGLTPLADNGDFIPNESFTAIYQDAQEAVADAREAEIHARQEERTFDQYQAALRNELLTQHSSYITPLKNLTGIDPILYNNLQTADDQTDFRLTVRARVEAMIDEYPNSDPSSVGELGELVLNILDQGYAVQMSVNNVENIYKRVDLAKWANVEIDGITRNATQSLKSTDLLFGVAEGLMALTMSATGGTPFAAAGGVLKGMQMSIQRQIQAFQTMQISDVQMEKEVRGLLIELNNLGIALERTQNHLQQSELRLDNALARMDRMIEDLAHTRNTAADLYFQDPSFRVVVSDAMRRAEAEMDYAIDKLYRLAKTLEYEWTEGYQNPLIIPVNCNEPASLENPLFDKFTQLTSLFNVQSADEGKDYLDALKAWDSKLRRINVTSVRGPNHAGPISAEPISLREDILGFSTENGQMTMEESLEAFRNYLATKEVKSYYNVLNPSLELDFATTIADNRFFPATGSRWNMRIHSISIELYAESGFSTKQVAEVDLLESGVVALRRYWAEPPVADDLKYLNFQTGYGNYHSAYEIAVPAKINGAMGGRPANEFMAMGLRGRPVAATKWVLRLDTENPSNADLEFDKLKDIIIKFTYTYGNPPEFVGF